MNPTLGAVGTADAVLDVEGVSKCIAVEKDQGAVVIVGMNSIEPRMRIGVEALAGASPNLFIGGANVKDAFLDDVDKPEDIGESRGDLLKRLASSACRALRLDAIEDFLVEAIDRLLKDLGLFFGDRLQ